MNVQDTANAYGFALAVDPSPGMFCSERFDAYVAWNPAFLNPAAISFAEWIAITDRRLSPEGILVAALLLPFPIAVLRCRTTNLRQHNHKNNRPLP